jgi:arabinofuranan 3-O-arabinosyltransferase
VTIGRRWAAARPRLGVAAPALVAASLVLVSLLQRPGRTTFDTKYDLLADPVGFLLRALQPWSAEINLGSLQNQASGFLFPIGPFFAAGDLLGVPVWAWQRLWSGLVLVIAFEGMRRLVLAWLPAPGGGSAVLAGLAYALAPRVVTTVGVLSGETLPGAVLPWTVLPLVLAARGRMAWWRAVVLSAASIPFMGGQNATEVIAILVLPGLVPLLTAKGWRVRLAATAGWSALVLVVTLWWWGPLLVLGRYAAPFLDFIESGAVTTEPVGWLEALRGATHWVAFLPEGVSHWAAGHALTYAPVLVVAVTLASVAGLAGLVSGRVPDREVLVLSFVIGMVVVTLGHGGPAGAPWSTAFRDLLDGPLAPFRNVHKVDPLIRLPLALGVVAALPLLGRLGDRLPAAWAPGRAAALRPHLGAGVLVVVVALGLAPALTGDLRADDGWRSTPTAWESMARTLQALPEPSRVLVVPAAPTLAQTWGRTVDEPVQAVRGVSWVSRSQLPLVPVGGIRLLDAIEAEVASGRPSERLAPLLQRAAISHVLLRTDLLPVPGDPSAERAAAAVTASPGLTEVVRAGRGPNGLPQLALYEVPGVNAPVAATSGRDHPFTGATDDLPALVDAGVASPGRRLVVTGEDPSVVVTDSPKRRERAFARTHDAVSEVLTADARWSSRRARHDFAPVPGAAPAVTEDPRVPEVTVSSSASSVEALGPLRPDEQPRAALDGSFLTRWASAPFGDPQAQWWQVSLPSPKRLGAVSVLFDPSGADVTRIRVTTDGGSVDAEVGPDGLATLPSLRGGFTTTLRIDVLSVAPGPATQVRIAEVGGVVDHSTRTVRLPGPVGPSSTVLLSTDPGRRSCVPSPAGPVCDPLAARGAEEPDGLRRTLTVEGGSTWTVSGHVVATGGPAAEALLAPLGDAVAAEASSVLGDEPLVGARSAVDGDPATSWVPATGDRAPSLTLLLPEPRVVTRVSLTSGEASASTLPTIEAVEVDGVQQRAWVRGAFVDLLEPVEGTTVTVRLRAGPGLTAVAEANLAGAEDLVERVDPGARTGTPCGFGPTLYVGDATVQTRVSGRIGDVRSGAPLELLPCRGGTVTVAEGDVDVVSGPAEGFAVQDVLLQSDEAPPRGRELDVAPRVWTADRRVVDVADGPPAVLSVAENANDGWVARVDGDRLDSVLVDGWAQGWRLPSGSDRTVTMTYEPAGFYRWSLLTGGVLAAAVVLLAGVAAVSRGRGPRPGAGGRPRVGLVLAVVAGLALLAGPLWALSVAAGAVAGRRPRLGTGVALGLCVLAMAVDVAIGGGGGWHAAPDVLAGVGTGIAVGLAAARVLRDGGARASA